MGNWGMAQRRIRMMIGFKLEREVIGLPLPQGFITPWPSKQMGPYGAGEVTNMGNWETAQHLIRRRHSRFSPWVP